MSTPLIARPKWPEPDPETPARERRHQPGVRLIAVFKLVKGMLLLAIGVGALSLVHRDVAVTVAHWVKFLRADPENRLVHLMMTKLDLANDRTLRAIGAGTFFYAGLLLTEGFGLLFEKTWAEYLTIVATGSFIPLELFELTRRVTVSRVTVLAINVAVVWYLAVTVIRDRRGAAAR